MFSPDGKRFRSKTSVRNYIYDNPHLCLREEMFDFCLHRPHQRKSLLFTWRNESTEPLTPADALEVDEQVNLLKIPLVDDAYKCPIEGCGKNFRRENLAQMHVKHYHPEYTKFLDSTPNVADLAYARTVGDSLDRSPGTPERPPKPPQPKQVSSYDSVTTLGC